MKLILCVISCFLPAIIFIEVRTQQIRVFDEENHLSYSRGPNAENRTKEIKSAKNSCRGATPCPLRSNTTKDNCTEVVSIEKGTEQIEIFKDYTRTIYANGSEAEEVNKTIRSIRNPSRDVTRCHSIKDNCPAAQCSVHSDDFLYYPDISDQNLNCDSRRSNATCFLNETRGVSGGWSLLHIAIDPEEIPYIEIFNFTIYGPTGLLEYTTNLTIYADPDDSGIARTVLLSFMYYFPSPLTTPTVFRFTLRASETDKFYNDYPYNIACFEKRFMTEKPEQRELN